MSLSLALIPKLSEKTYEHSEKLRVYAFLVPKSANTQLVKQAVEAQYKVSVTKVNVLNQTGKTKRTYRRSGRSVEGQRNSYKKAYVTLKEGDVLPIFASSDDGDKKTEKKEAK